MEGCKHELEISIPAEAVEAETIKVTKTYQERAKLPGFRPGKAPASLVRRNFAGDIRQQVLEQLVPRFFEEKAKEENLRVVGTPNISDVHFHDGAPLRFKAHFEVFPEFDPAEYKGVEVPYRQPEVSDEDVEKRIAELRESKATYVNEDPRPLRDGDHAVISLESVSGAETPIKSDEVVVLIAGPETLAGFTENLREASPGDEKEFDVTYPEDYGQEKLSGKTIRFKVTVKGLRRKELPEVNDDFAQDLGDFRTMDELRDALRKSIFAQREVEAQREAKDKLVDKLVDANTFPVPEKFVEKQIENRVEQRLRSLAQQGVDPRSFNLDWSKIKDAQREAATREVKASLILGKVAEREAIGVTNDEVDREVQRIAQQNREPIATVRKKLTEDGTLDRIASHIQTEKTLNFLFDKATKTEPEPEPEPVATPPEAE
ncbi:MAG TPA: trigger factor [Bryobacteraceae bacterium]|nr:trigger factor [Bryobacteraceae bacterium]